MANLDVAKDYEFDTSEELYCYIVDSYMNGQKKQVHDIIRELNDQDLFFDWMRLSGVTCETQLGIIKTLV